MIDLPLADLYKYTGSNPFPDDFDSFWDEQYKLLENCEKNIELNDTGIIIEGCKLYDLYFSGVDGAKVYAKYIRREEDLSPVILYFHGYRRSSPSWSNLLQYVAIGFSVIAMDCRGQGGRSEDISIVKGNTFAGHFVRGLADGPHNMLMHFIMLDAAETALIAKSLSHSLVVSYGASQGGALALACAGLCNDVNSVISLCPFLCDYKRVWQTDLGGSAYSELIEYFRMFDPRHEHEDEIFYRLGYIDVQNFAHRITADVLMMTGLMDDTCPPSSQFAVYNKICSEKRMIVYPDFAHEVPSDMEDEVLNTLLEIKTRRKDEIGE